MNEPNILIKNAVFEAMSHIASGDTPTEALRKTAEAHDLNANYIQRVGEVMNVTLHHEHFKTAADKSANFKIADIPEVTQQVFGQEKKKDVKHPMFKTTPVSADRMALNKRLTDPKFKQAYLKILQTPDVEDHFPTSQSGLMDQSANYIHKLAKVVDETKTRFVGAKLAFNRAFSKVVAQFSKDAQVRTPFEEFESQVFATYGEKSVPFLDEIYKHATLDRTSKHDARGVHDAKYTMFDPCRETQLFGEFLKAAEELLAAKTASEDAVHNYDYEKSFLKSAHVKMASKHCPICGVGTCKCETGSKPEVKQEEVKKEETKIEDSDPVMTFVKKKAVAQATAEPSGAPPEKKAEELTDDEVVSKVAFDVLKSMTDFLTSSKTLHKELGSRKSDNVLRQNVGVDNVSRTAILQELIMTDPILSKVDVRKVIAAYEQLLAIAPHISTQKEVVRAMLRQMVQGQALSPYDAGQFIEADMAMMKHKMLQAGQHKDRITGKD